MLKSRLFILPLLCLAILLGTGSCQRKGIPCPKPAGSSGGIFKVFKKKAPNSGATMQGIQVPMGKNGLVKKKRM
ncbi:hypothetical protein [Pontibacter vulgaris]|uniref:hypothetical protein n=1 Tax=Pontibacter vulgaris TaxID=2905679 RepID=UPI001FA7149E|nr:hypothetical protein [Pontibacter vulgaris]